MARIIPNNGMFPNVPLGRFRQVGNASGMGAKQLLVSAQLRQAAAPIARRIEYIELANHPDFQDTFVNASYLRQAGH